MATIDDDQQTCPECTGYIDDDDHDDMGGGMIVCRVTGTVNEAS